MRTARSDLLSAEGGRKERGRGEGKGGEGNGGLRSEDDRSPDRQSSGTAAGRRLFLRPLGSKSTRGGGNNTFWGPARPSILASLPRLGPLPTVPIMAAAAAATTSNAVVIRAGKRTTVRGTAFGSPTTTVTAAASGEVSLKTVITS